MRAELDVVMRCREMLATLDYDGQARSLAFLLSRFQSDVRLKQEYEAARARSAQAVAEAHQREGVVGLPETVPEGKPVMEATTVTIPPLEAVPDEDEDGF